ncbi:hypothetical protein LRS10_12140 [Phenylobacterium sp. J426]|uniref:DUF6665 family protein n=1 Tax=Phenylobacterium sp. J426 TaxID=2898439 RepID=UPI0021512102|nr:DUF6665 family protein [Phenylobacterium sp. J426]MCR5874852.1 hypothetical protein [Phenylobacterium sp. J426]
MSPLRMPQHLADPPHVDSGEAVLRFKLLEELDTGLKRNEDRVEAALAALRRHDAEGRHDPDLRSRLLEHAADAVWSLFVQHEACDCADHDELVRRYGIPPEVTARIGAAH